MGIKLENVRIFVLYLIFAGQDQQLASSVYSVAIYYSYLVDDGQNGRVGALVSLPLDRMMRPAMCHQQRMLNGGSPSWTTYDTWTLKLTSETGGIACAEWSSVQFKFRDCTYFTPLKWYRDGQDKKKRKKGFSLYPFIFYRFFFVRQRTGRFCFHLSTRPVYWLVVMREKETRSWGSTNGRGRSDQHRPVVSDNYSLILAKQNLETKGLRNLHQLLIVVSDIDVPLSTWRIK